MSFHLQLEGRRALVTAGTKGVGGAVVRALAEAGVVVAATARHLPEKGLEGVHYIAADLARAVGCAAAVTTVQERFGGVDILVNVLGGSASPAGGFAALGDEE